MRRTMKPTALGREIRLALMEQDITVRELASRIHKSEATVCEVISGKNRSAKTRDLILRELNLKFEEDD